MSEIGNVKDIISLQADSLRGLFEILMALNEAPFAPSVFHVLADVLYDLSSETHKAVKLLDEAIN